MPIIKIKMGGIQMKIGISARGKTLDSLLDERFGRCEYFLIYDTKDKQTSVLENKGQLASGGAGIKAAQQLIDEKVDVIITGHLGPNAYELIDKSGIKAYECKTTTINSVIQRLEKGELTEIREAGSAHHSI